MPKKLKLSHRKYQCKRNDASSLVLSIPLTAACVPTLIVMQKWINQLSVLPPGIGLFASICIIHFSFLRMVRCEY